MVIVRVGSWISSPLTKNPSWGHVLTGGLRRSLRKRDWKLEEKWKPTNPVQVAADRVHPPQLCIREALVTLLLTEQTNFLTGCRGVSRELHWGSMCGTEQVQGTQTKGPYVGIDSGQ